MKNGHRMLRILCVLALSSAALSVEKTPDFSGTWMLDKTEVSMPPAGGGAFPAGGSGYPGGGGFPGDSGGFPGGGGGFPGGGGGYPGGGGGSPGGGGGRGGGRGGGYPGAGRGGTGSDPRSGMDDPNLMLTITQTPLELRIERSRNAGTPEPPIVQTFALDGKESSTPDDRGRGMLKARVKWNKSKLVIDGSQRVTSNGRDFEVKTRRELALSKNGQILTIQTSRTLPSGIVMTKQVFKKSP